MMLLELVHDPHLGAVAGMRNYGEREKGMISRSLDQLTGHDLSPSLLLTQGDWMGGSRASRLVVVQRSS